MELTGNKYGGRDWRKLLGTRRGTALVAAVCAILAAAILIFAAQRYRQHVDANGSPETVFVASTLIQKGTAGSAIANEHLFKATSILARQASTGAISDASVLQGKVAVADILPGQQLTAADFTGSGGVTAQLSPGDRAMTITVDSAHGMIGQIKDGDRVDVYGGLTDELAGRSRAVLVLLMRNIQVLKAGTSSSGGGLGAANNPQSQNSNVTLNVPAAQVSDLAFAAENGKVWLVLRPADAGATTPPSAVTVQSLLAGATARSGS